MTGTWILIANASEAHIYDLDHSQFLKGKIKLKLLDSLEHPQSRMKDSELVADRPGSYRAGHSGKGPDSHGSYLSQTEPKEHEAEVFALDVAHALEKARVANLFQKLILIAPAHFQGFLKKHMNKNVENLISERFEKDYTKIPMEKLNNYMHQHLIDAVQ